ncbi:MULTISPECIES: ATP-binding protein [unclassified Nodularia (in: cyanobacteria)]|uniref:AAA family ATPase n=1 Tax=unclassified Nodularia (in: cyanobacteria) TaxID=2656917 RepID=UPI0018812928|nr:MULTISPECIES: ATP-binding protein [unclassified Nodularia (in: cyanobacteria)]MBE9199570.1 AAA family ATPase [Nodularia sp. LEGE 06071]MCC2691383.1 AAA family ATPase [Nodularia sp. LEGE 04288]
MLKELHLNSVGPASQFDVEFADRLNIFTGDNGLGKSFLLEVAWWVLTGNWVDQPAYPQRNTDELPKIISKVNTRNWEILFDEIDNESSFNFSEQKWQKNLSLSDSSKNIVIFVRVDGGFSVFDPARKRDLAYNFDPDTLWNGLKLKGKVVCNGLIHDWVKWQNQAQKTPFQLLSRVIKQLAPHPDEWIEIGEPTRVSVEDVRDIPTINLPYGNIPIIQASAGMKRILGLAYLLVWAWYEHEKASELRRQEPMNQIVLLIDEVESHLHPRWQRVILPSILSVLNEFQSNMKVQVLATTHSPLVLASLEPIFDEEQDKLFLFELENGKVSLDEISWVKQGDTVGWLTSEIFGLKQARCQEAETAIEAAEAWMRYDDMNNFPEHLRNQPQIHQELQKLLPGHDPFWPRWIVTAEKRNSG